MNASVYNMLIIRANHSALIIFQLPEWSGKVNGLTFSLRSISRAKASPWGILYQTGEAIV